MPCPTSGLCSLHCIYGGHGIGREGKFFLKFLAGKLAEKQNTPYSATCGYVNAFISLAVVRSVHNCCFGSRIRYKKMSRQFDPGWADGKGMLY